ncbi:dapper homolog 3 isoform X1 [Xenopus laevis]|uniref:Dapper homolog 3 isoform X1 n=1 Tax=Xenopus laevis TaxID=8355 RepID=A0A8J0TNR8_XENLA|nr:dapper homolog 3 isoform X1 [Xenopus laevis]
MLGSGGGGDRGRLRHLLRSSVAGLCELKLLRDRQEVRVRRALQGGEDLDRQLWELERQLGELRLRAENDNENVECEADGMEASDVFVERSSRGGLTEARMHYANERPKSAGDIVVGSQHPRSSSSRLLVPRSLSVPYPSPSSPSPPPPLSRRAEGYIISLLRRQLRPPYLRSASAERPPPPPPPPASGCRIANVSYTPPHRVSRRKHPPLLKGHSVEGSPPRLPRKCLSAEEPPRKRGGRRTPRSLSETSLRDPSHLGEEWNVPKGYTEGGEGPRGNAEGWVHPRVRAELWGKTRSQTEGWVDPRGLVQDWGENRGYIQEGGRCYTLGREGRAPPVKTGPPCRKWRSTAEISGGGPEEESRVDSEGEEEEEGELVWPLQLPPRDADGHPQMFKVKASQALKKKIMRFNTGSLKVMTTV